MSERSHFLPPPPTPTTTTKRGQPTRTAALSPPRAQADGCLSFHLPAPRRRCRSAGHPPSRPQAAGPAPAAPGRTGALPAGEGEAGRRARGADEGGPGAGTAAPPSPPPHRRRRHSSRPSGSGCYCASERRGTPCRLDCAGVGASELTQPIDARFLLLLRPSRAQAAMKALKSACSCGRVETNALAAAVALDTAEKPVPWGSGGRGRRRGRGLAVRQEMHGAAAGGLQPARACRPAGQPTRRWSGVTSGWGRRRCSWRPRPTGTSYGTRAGRFR